MEKVLIFVLALGVGTFAGFNGGRLWEKKYGNHTIYVPLVDNTEPSEVKPNSLPNADKIFKLDEDGLLTDYTEVPRYLN